MRSYLRLLKFPPQLLHTLQAGFFHNVRFPALFIALVTALGMWSYLTVPRTLNPEINIPIIITSTVLPGASPQEIESLITIPLEKEVKNVANLTNYTSSSSENVSTIVAEFSSSSTPKDAREAVKSAIGNVVLPEDAQDPVTTEIDFENIPSYTFALTTNNPDDFPSLMRLADKIKTDLEVETGVDRVTLSGFDNQNIEVVVDLNKSLDLGLDPMTLGQNLKAAISSYPSGSVRNDGLNYPVSVNKTVASIADIRQLPINRADQFPLTIGAIAQVNERSGPDQNHSYLASQDKTIQPAVKLAVYKSDSARLDEVAKLTEEKVKTILKPYGDSYQTIVIQDYAEETSKQFNDLANNFVQTLALVFLSMFVVYGLRQALVAAIAIPFPLLMTFIIMKATNIGLNFLSIFSLLLALGLFVDNTVVIIEGFTTYMATKKFTPLQAALLVWRDFSIPLISINLVTAWAFLPLIFSGGIIGEFIKPIPIIVSASMFASVAIALLFTLPSMMYLVRPHVPHRLKVAGKILTIIALLILGISIIPKTAVFLPTFLAYVLLLVIAWLNRQSLKPQLKPKHQRLINQYMNQGMISLTPIIERYRHYLEKLVDNKRARKKALAIIIVFTLFTYALLPLGLVVNEFFPKSDTTTLFVELELPVGTRGEVTQAQAMELMESLRQEPDVKNVLLEIGSSVMAEQSFGGGAVSANTAMLTLLLGDRNTRDRSSIELAQDLRDRFTNNNGRKISVVEVSGGPPAGSDIVATFLGDDLGQLETYAETLENKLKTNPGVTNIARSIKLSPSQIAFVPNTANLKHYGLSEAAVGGALRTLISGTTLAKVRFSGDEETDVIFRYDQNLITPQTLSALSLPSGEQNVPLTELGTFTLQPNPSQIARDNGKRSLTVSAGALPGFSVTSLNGEVKNFIDNEMNLGSGYSWQTGGANEENAKSIQSILQAMVLSAILILITMIVQLGSFRKAFLVMLVIPLAVSGVFFWFALLGIPLSFPALIGVLSLFGIVIANSIVLVDKINQNLNAGLDKNTALIDAGASRLEPILLTSLASIVGLVPITLADPLWLGLGGAIIAGLSVSGTLMLFFTPIMYLYLYPGKTEGK